MNPTYELILAEYFDLPEHHKFFDITMEFDTKVDEHFDGSSELVVTDSYVEITIPEGVPCIAGTITNTITVEDLVALGNEFLPESRQWLDVDQMLSDFSAELNDDLS
tara:strand:- start:774 stop:1094 length:321 start_codon:yes stop_codon:yes gene_type:complete